MAGARTWLPPLAALAAWSGVFAGWTHGFRAFTSASAVLAAAGPLPRPAPELAYQDQLGRAGRVGEPSGRVRLVQFFYANCSDACPLAMARVHGIMDALPPEAAPRVEIVSLSVDRDPVGILRSLWEAHDSPAWWTMAASASGTFDEEMRRLGAWATRRADGGINHTVDFFLVDGAGVLRAVFAPAIEPQQIAASAAAALAAEPGT